MQLYVDEIFKSMTDEPTFMNLQSNADDSQSLSIIKQKLFDFLKYLTDGSPVY